ncbi:hypothetical protein Y032_0596g448 [Ancylostoma ceylanicum]|uniref:Thioredoxin domain-containing protein n=1 Tax=Ancylostoma ceylanicum TaxID=53326 RepID=A0A016WLV8_9BILA|nr:hypothetical protein Y032_0596g448 [Ancylostoma ceylanicum]
MRLLVTVSLLLLTDTIISTLAEHVNIDVYSQTKDETVVGAIRRVAAAINADNRYVVASVNERDCSDTDQQECSGDDAESVFVTINSPDTSNVQVSGLIRKRTKLEKEVQKLFAKFSGKRLARRSEETDNIEWWNYRLAAPAVKHLEQLEKLIQKSNEKITFALYYHPEGYENFAAYYVADELFSSGAAYGLVVDCSKEETICKRESIETTPTLIAYENAKQYKRYSLEIDAVSIHDWIKTIQQPIITKLTEDAVPYYREGAIPGFDEPRPSVIIFFASTRKSDVYKNYKRFAREHHGDYHLTELIDTGIEKWAHQPAFVAMKPLETISKANTHYEDITYESMADFIEENQHPSVHPITDARALFTVFSLNRPVLIFHDVTKAKNTTYFATLAADYTVRSTVAAFALNESLSMIGLFLADLLDIDVLTPSYVLVDAKKGCIYTKRISNENEMEIKHWLTTASEGNCKKAVVDMKKLAALRNWERRDDLRRAVEEKLSRSQHDEL